MPFIDLLKPSRTRFPQDADSDDESKTAFLDDKASTRTSKHGKAITAGRSLYWTMYCFMVSTILLLSVTLIQCRGRGTIETTEL
jgi:hypothetical protein